MTLPIIKVKNLLFQYKQDGKPVINRVSFTIKKGTHTVIVGHNGSGKSTLSKLLIGLYRPTGGTITIDGITITKKTLKTVRKRIGMVFQNPDNQFVGSTVEDDVAFSLENRQVKSNLMPHIIQELVRKVGMEAFLDKEPHFLSGGQKQRVAIASTLALKPKIIIFDEVTSMLDPRGRKDVLKIIHEIKKGREQTLVAITHDMDEAVMADHVIVMADGSIIASGPPKKVLSNPQIVQKAKIDHPFVYKLSTLFADKLPVNKTFSEKGLVEQLCKLK